MPASHKCAKVETRYFKMGGLFLYGTGQRAAGSIHFSRRKTLTWRGPKQNITSLYLQPSRSKQRSLKRRLKTMQNSSVYGFDGSSIVLVGQGIRIGNEDAAYPMQNVGSEKSVYFHRS